jgi:DNA-binding NarL/FixJ family response regulator
LGAWEESRWNLIVDDNLSLAEISPRFSSSTVTRRNLPAAPRRRFRRRARTSQIWSWRISLAGRQRRRVLEAAAGGTDQVRAMVISAYTDDGTIDEATAAGARFMPKPLDFVRLTRWVGEASS